MTEHTDTLKIVIIQLLLEYNSAVIRIMIVRKKIVYKRPFNKATEHNTYQNMYNL